MILGLTYYQVAVFFLIYSFLGWCLEVAYHALKLGIVTNRGFLCGPVCPVYGFGMLGILMTLGENRGDIWATFFTGMIVCSFIEWLAGWMLMQFFHARWWDYSNERFNLHGYICLKFSVYWGFATVLAVDGIHPLISSLSMNILPEIAGWAIMAFIYMTLVVDMIATILAVAGINKKLSEIDELRSDLRHVSDELTDKIANSSINTQKKIAHNKEEVKAFMTEQKQITSNNIAELKEDASRIILAKYQDTLEHNLVAKRMLKAFPSLKHYVYPEAFEGLKNAQAKG